MQATPTLAIAEFEPIAAALAGIEKYRGLVVDVKTAEGMRHAKAVHREVSAPRIALEKARKQLKEDVLVRGRRIDDEAKRIGAQFAAIEDPIKAQIDAEEQRAELERVAAIAAEQRRLQEEEAARKRDEEEALAKQRAELARQAAALKAEQDRLQEEDRARRRALAAEEDASLRRIEEQNRAAAAVREEADRKAAESRRAEEARLDEERRKVEEERRKIDAEEERKRQSRLAEEERQQQNQRVAERKAAELLDARHMLEVWFEKYGHLQQFKTVAGAIGIFLTKPKAKRAA